ncbi:MULTISPECIES: META domain-containing protein [unclassified Carboxylicivirga]|uniref:META domain-containing protein n=1 Tax=Carboxylicivirga TaxID=1628153 RepID=UPI003D3558AB
MKKVIFALLAISTMMSCKTQKNTIPATQLTPAQSVSEQFTETNQWELSSFKGQTPAEAGFVAKTPMLVINKAEQKAGGNGGCNSFGAQILIEGDNITFSNVFSTKMYCGGVPENEFFKLLQQKFQYKISGNTLELIKDDVVLLAFTLKAE